MTASSKPPVVYVYRRNILPYDMPWSFRVADRDAPRKLNAGCFVSREAAIAAAQACAPDCELYAYAEDDHQALDAIGATTAKLGGPIDATTIGDLVQVLRRLVAWENNVGGWNAPCWREARVLLRRLEAMSAITSPRQDGDIRLQSQTPLRPNPSEGLAPPADLAALLELHPLPWSIDDQWRFGDETPLAIVDGSGDPFLAIATHAASVLDAGDGRDQVVAEALISLIADADTHRHAGNSASSGSQVAGDHRPGEAG